MRLDKPIVCRYCLKNIHEKYLLLATTYPNNSVRLNYFLAASEYFSQKENFDYDNALKLRPYGGLIGIDNSSLDSYLNNSKILRLHAILHDAGGFIQELYTEGPGYSYMLPWKLNSCFTGHLTGILFCLYIKVFHSKIYHLLEC